MARKVQDQLQQTSNKNQQWVLRARPEGAFDPSIHFEKRTVELPKDLSEGQVLAKVLFLSFDAAQRLFMTREVFGIGPMVGLGEPMRAIGMAQVIESKHSSFSSQDLVMGWCNWQEYVLFEPDKKKEHEETLPFQKVPNLPGQFDPTRMLAFLPTGLTAYFGMMEIGKPQKGDAVLVSSAAGATGSVAGQIAKIKGCKKVVGIAGGPAKCAWLVDKAGFDDAIDYKSENLGDRLNELFPDGVDLFFDNVGGEILDTALLHLAKNARVVLCGSISHYDLKESEQYGLKHTGELVLRRVTAKGFELPDYLDRAAEGLLCLNEWAENGQLILEIDQKDGFDRIPATLQRLYTGANQGKQILKLSDPPLPLRTSLLESAVVQAMRLYYVYWKGLTSTSDK